MRNAGEQKSMKGTSTLNKAEVEALEKILDKDPSALSEEEKAHLRAREVYLTNDEKETFAVAFEKKEPKEPKEPKAPKEPKEPKK